MYVRVHCLNEIKLATQSMCYFYDTIAVRLDTQIWVNADIFWSGKANSMSMRDPTGHE